MHDEHFKDCGKTFGLLKRSNGMAAIPKKRERERRGNLKRRVLDKFIIIFFGVTSFAKKN